MTHGIGRRPLRELLLIGFLSVVLVGCSATSSEPMRSSTGGAGTAGGTSLETGTGAGVRSGEAFSRVKSYRSIAELNRDAAAVIEATPTGKFTVSHVGPPMTLYQVLVTTVMHGSVALPEVSIQVDGDATNPLQVVEDGVRLQAGHTYVMFISATTLPGHPSTVGHYLIVGIVAGLYAEDGQRNLHKVDPDSPDLPALVPRSEMQRLVSAS